MTTTTETTPTTTNRSDFAWPYLAQRQRIFNWDRYEYKVRPECEPTRPPQWFHCPETLEVIPYSQRLLFDFEFSPKPILDATERAIQYEKERTNARNTRPRVFRCPQFSLDDIPADVQDSVNAFTYTTTKKMSELTSGVPPPRTRSIGHVDASSKQSGCEPGKQPLFKTPKNLRRVSIEWDESQKRIFGGRSVD